MKERMLSKGLAVGVILLFIGISIQPAIAVNPISIDSEEDCDICPSVSKKHMIGLKSLINRGETLNNKLSVVSKHSSEVTDKYQELSDRIITLKEMNKIFNSNNLFNFFSGCLILTIIIGLYSVVFFSPLLLVPIFERTGLSFMSDLMLKFYRIFIFPPIFPVFGYWFINCAGGIIFG